MEFHDAANVLFDLRRFRPRPGTEATRDLLSYLDNPHADLACVQVAGSNGKGSTARMVASVLREAGLSVGLYTSPHLDDVRERVRVDGRKVSKAALREFVEDVEPYLTERAADGTGPTFFEAMTGFALREFGRQGVDVAVLEVGIGGRYDATSVVDPVASAVTSVTLEHTEFLGDTVAEIARDKAHVAPAAGEGPLVTAATGDALAAVREVAPDVLTVGTDGEREGADAPEVRVRYGGRENDAEAAVDLVGADWAVETRVPLLGAHQATNAGVAAALARTTATAEGVDLSEEDIVRGLRKAYWPGRTEVVSHGPRVMLDGAHNPGACERLTAVLGEFDYDRLHLVVGAMADKDLCGMAAALPTPETVVACRPDLDRAEDEAAVAAAFEARDGVETRRAVASAVERALDRADDDDFVLVTGSLFTVAEARTRWTRVEIPKRVDSLAAAERTLEGADVTDPGVWRMRGKAVHRVVKTRVQPRQASYLKQELLSLGGECAVSGLEDSEENVDVVMMGTFAQFRRLADKLESQPYGLSPFADELRDALGFRAVRPAADDPVDTSRQPYPWEEGTAVMGILNVTPDSFHDGGQYDTTEAAVERAREMVAAGADVVDVGGESTRPGADPVPPERERERVVPVVERIADLDVLVSVDTRKASVARAALEAGADVLNDVSGLEDPEMRFVAAEYDVPLVVMHSLDAPVDPDREATYDDVVEDVLDDLRERVLRAVEAGLDRSQVIVDPGLGFAKSREQNFELLGRVGEFRALGCPVLVGHSHKSMYDLVDRSAGERGPATVAATALAADRGADVVRVHDVAENVAAVRTALRTNASAVDRE